MTMIADERLAEVPLVTLASFRAMQARAEVAEEALRVSELEGDAAFALAVDDPGKNPPVTWKSRAEAAEARVKEMEEALENWQRATGRYYDVTTEYFSDTAFDADGNLADADGAIYVLLDELRRALKGDHHE